VVGGRGWCRHTVFEFVVEGAGGSESGGAGPVGTVLAGGRYDGLVAAVGGPAGVPSIGWAAGLERLMLLSAPPPPPPEARPVLLLPVLSKGAAALPPHVEALALQLGARVRAAGTPIVTAWGVKAVKKGLGGAAKSGSQVAVILGEDEAARGVVNIKCLVTGQQTTHAIDTPDALAATAAAIAAQVSTSASAAAAAPSCAT